jgi:signal transduction histidine kinase
VTVRAEDRDGRVRLWVEDNGIGIAPEHHERVFRVFERLHAAEEYPGTGIGLAIVRKGAERMGGRAGLESTPGQGSRFWIELSLAEERNERERHSDTAG